MNHRIIDQYDTKQTRLTDWQREEKKERALCSHCSRFITIHHTLHISCCSWCEGLIWFALLRSASLSLSGASVYEHEIEKDTKSIINEPRCMYVCCWEALIIVIIWLTYTCTALIESNPIEHDDCLVADDALLSRWAFFFESRVT